MSKKVITIILLIVVGVLSAVAWFLLNDVDRVRPVITFTDGEISYTEGEDVSVLLSNVQAYDDRDGDLTADIRVDQITPVNQKTKARVSYVVMDSQKNIATASQIVNYTPLVENTAYNPVDAEVPEEMQEANPAAPVLVLSADSDMIKPSDSFNYMSYIASITDDVDSQDTLFENIVIDGDFSSNSAGTYPLMIYVTDSDGNISNQETFVLIRG